MHDVLLLLEQDFLLVSQLTDLSFQFLDILIVLLVVGLLEQLFRLFWSFCLKGDLLLVPVKDWSRVSRRTLFSRPLILWFSILVQLLLFLRFFLYFFFVLRLLIQRFARIDKTLLNVLFRHVFWHKIIIYRRVDRN